MSSCDGISSCVFLKDGQLATTSFDGKIEMWDTGNGCRWNLENNARLNFSKYSTEWWRLNSSYSCFFSRTALIDGHSNAITASDVTADKKHLATVSLDFMLKVTLNKKKLFIFVLFCLVFFLNSVTFKKNIQNVAPTKIVLLYVFSHNLDQRREERQRSIITAD